MFGMDLPAVDPTRLFVEEAEEEEDSERVLAVEEVLGVRGRARANLAYPRLVRTVLCGVSESPVRRQARWSMSPEVT